MDDDDVPAADVARRYANVARASVENYVYHFLLPIRTADGQRLHLCIKYLFLEGVFYAELKHSKLTKLLGFESVCTLLSQGPLCTCCNAIMP